MLKKLPIAEIVIVLLSLAAGVGVYWWAHRDEGRLEESKERGSVIVQGLESYHARHGIYPESLDELVPDHAPGIEPPTWGLERWRYRRFTPEDVAAAASAAAYSPAAPVEAGDEAATGGVGDRVYFQLSVAANQSGYPVLYYDYTARRWVLNN
jgi:hypothetical protein